MLDFLERTPRFHFLHDLIPQWMANRNDYPLFRFTFKGCPVDFAFSVYRSIMSVLLRFTPTESLEFPFSHDLAVDLTLLRMHEFPSAPLMLINRKAALTPITSMPALASDASHALARRLTAVKKARKRFCDMALSDAAVTLAGTLSACLALNRYLAFYGTFPVWDASEATTATTTTTAAAAATTTTTTPENTHTTLHAIDETAFVNPALDALLARLLRDSCVVLGRLLPPWLDTTLTCLPALFSLSTRTHYLYPRRSILTCSDCYCFNAHTSYTNLFTTCHSSLYAQSLQPMVVTTSFSHAQLMRYTAIRQNPVFSLLYLSSVFDKSTETQVRDRNRADFQTKFYGEEGIGNGPTTECLTLFFHEVQRRSLHLWNEASQTPYAAQSTARMLNYPPRGPEATGLEDPREDAVNGVLLRCQKCACLEGCCCPEHHCLLSADRVRSE